MTVGISHLTTSRRLRQPATAVEVGPGSLPVRRCHSLGHGCTARRILVTGAVLADGRKLLVGLAHRPSGRRRFARRSRWPRFRPHAPAKLCSRESKSTRADVLAGPAADVMSQPGAVGTAGLETSALALGQAHAALAALAAIEPAQLELAEPLEVLCENWQALWSSSSPRHAASPTRSRRADPKRGEYAGAAIDPGLPGRDERDRVLDDRACPALGAASPVLPGLVLPHPGRARRHS